MRKETTERAPQIRELFIEELAQVNGGGPDYKEVIEKVRDEIREFLTTTTALCEEGAGC